ncbi:MAG: STELLO glycosyltransferase family protein [Chlamydiales bacterium]
MIRIFLFFIGAAPLFSMEQWIVVTTIQYPTPALCKLAQIPGWQLVVVGDKKTPPDWHLDGCIYLSPERQLALGYALSALLPWNHYCRKNIGYLYAIEQGAKVIYETDDDNEPLDDLRYIPCDRSLPLLFSQGDAFNIYAYFGSPEVWPRGFPFPLSHSSAWAIHGAEACRIGIEQGVVNGSPDVDAIFRLTQDRTVVFDPMPPCFLPPGLFCPINSQNTFFHKNVFFALYLPSTVTMRVADIWRGYIAQKMLWSFGSVTAFSGPNAYQERNPHVLLHDFSMELDLYLKAPLLIDFLKQWDSEGKPLDRLAHLYRDLIEENFFQKAEAPLIDAWIQDVRKVSPNEHDL